MSPQQLEFAITQYLDGTLPPEDVAALEQRLAEDAAARATLEEHQKLTAMLRAEPVPALAWDELASDLRAVVTGTVDQEARAQDQKLNALLKSAATPLPDIRWDALATQISGSIDREVALRDEQDDALDEALRALPTPNLNWDRLAAHLSSAVATSTADSAKIDHAEVAKEPVRERVYSLKWVRRASQFALAACLAVAAAVGIRAYLRPTAVTPDNTGTDQLTVVADKGRIQVDIGGPEKSPATAVAQISIGPSAEYARLQQRESYDGGFASSRSPIVIALPVSASDEFDRNYGMFE
jgi:anti-sigma factor RsiW